MPDTVNVAGGKGLLNYLVVVPPNPVEITHNKIPEELALIVYQSEEKYSNIRLTPAGQAYGDLHWKYFESDLSKSHVALLVTPQTQIEMNAAYDLVGKKINWNTASTAIAIYQRKPAVSDTLYFNEWSNYIKEKVPANINGRIVLLKTGFAAVYEHSPGKFELAAPDFEYSTRVMLKLKEPYEKALEQDAFYGVY